MFTVVFWNVGKQKAPNRVANVARHHDVDLLLIAEAAFEPAALLRPLNTGADALTSYFHSPGCRRVLMFGRFPLDSMKPLSETAYFSIRRLHLPGRKPITLAAAHLSSKLFTGASGSRVECDHFADAVRAVEESEDHSRTVVVGDFNSNPFEEGIAVTTGFNAVMDRAVACAPPRKVRGVPREFFYNPMWNLFGDHGGGPAGSYYAWRPEEPCYYWNMFDQVLIRPALLSSFHSKDLQILTTDGGASLLDQDGRPDTVGASDHLPILFRLNL